MAKRALCIGINDYPGTQNDLKGCVNDANDWAAELKRRGFETELLLDSKATKANITSHFKGMLSDAKHDDSIVFTYSGHGTWVPDKNGDEEDQRDEALCPHDIATAGPLIDDDLYEIFTARRPGVRLAFIADSCHSGTVARYFRTGEEDRRIKFMPPELYAPKESLRAMRALQKAPQFGRARRSALLIAGCQDSEYSYDATFGSRANGAFTRVALDVLAKQKPATYGEWFKAIRGQLPSVSYPQRPNLVATDSQRHWPVLS